MSAESTFWKKNCYPVNLKGISVKIIDKTSYFYEKAANCTDIYVKVTTIFCCHDFNLCNRFFFFVYEIQREIYHFLVNRILIAYIIN